MENYNEIKLIDYIRAIYKKRNLILAVLLICVIIAGVYSFFIAKEVYKTETILQVGTIEIKKNSINPIEEAIQVVEKAQNGFYGDYDNVRIISPDKTQLLIIEIIGEKIEDSEKTLENITQAILADHNVQINYYKEVLEERQNQYQVAIEELNKDIVSLMYSGQQISGLKLEIYSYQFFISSLETQIKSFVLTKVVKEITSFKNPVAPKPLLNIIVGGLIGIFLGVLWVLVTGWWEKNKYEIKK